VDREERNILQSWARGLKIELHEARIDLFSLYLDELCTWNSKINLTGISSLKKIIRELLLDSILTSLFLPEKGRLLDVGSGAGFPAIPIKICCPGLGVIMVEPNSKKVAFLKQVVRLTRLSGIEVIQGRVEENGKTCHLEFYDIITARALAPLPKTIALCAPLLAPGGRLITFQGQNCKNTVKESESICEKHSLRHSKIVRYNLPGKSSLRHLLFFERCDESMGSEKGPCRC